MWTSFLLLIFADGKNNLNKYEKNKNLFNIKPIFLKKLDEKIDDGIHNRGLARGSCTLNYSTRDDSASYDLAKSCKALLFSLE